MFPAAPVLVLTPAVNGGIYEPEVQRPINISCVSNSTYPVQSLAWFRLINNTLSKFSVSIKFVSCEFPRYITQSTAVKQFRRKCYCSREYPVHRAQWWKLYIYMSSSQHFYNV